MRLGICWEEQLRECMDPTSTSVNSIGPTIRNVETGEEWPIVFPEDVLRLGNSFIPRLVLQGPFLRVVDVGEDCLPLRANPALDAEELACAAERVLLQDQGDVVTDEGVTWHRVRTPAGTDGWADDQFLE